MDGREAARSVAIGRVVIGAGLLAAPGLGTELWLGRAAKSPAGQLLIRALGARDLGLGAATLAASGGEGPLKPLLVAGLLADTTDLAATVLARDRLPATAVPLLALAAGSGIVAGAIALAGAGGDGGAPVPA